MQEDSESDKREGLGTIRASHAARAEIRMMCSEWREKGRDGRGKGDGQARTRRPYGEERVASSHLLKSLTSARDMIHASGKLLGPPLAFRERRQEEDDEGNQGELRLLLSQAVALGEGRDLWTVAAFSEGIAGPEFVQAAWALQAY